MINDGTSYDYTPIEPYSPSSPMQQEKLRMDLIERVRRWLPKHVLPWFEELING